MIIIKKKLASLEASGPTTDVVGIYVQCVCVLEWVCLLSKMYRCLLLFTCLPSLFGLLGGLCFEIFIYITVLLLTLVISNTDIK